MKLLITSLVFFVVAGCSSLGNFFFPTDTSESLETEWRKNMKMKINGVNHRGLAVVEAADIYEILIYPSRKEIDRLQWGTCHGDDFADNAVKNSFWPWKKDDKFFRLVFRPNPIELSNACPLQIEELAQRHRTMDFGMVIFPDYRPHFRLAATLECNRSTDIRSGVSGCQAPVGTLQKIQFANDVIHDDRPNEKCPPLTKVREGVFEFFMAKSECVYLFKSNQKDSFGNYLSHRLYTFGYEDNPPPKGE